MLFYLKQILYQSFLILSYIIIYVDIIVKQGF